MQKKHMKWVIHVNKIKKVIKNKAKQSIHPTQNKIINETMRPTKETIKWAKEVIETIKNAQKQNKVIR